MSSIHDIDMELKLMLNGEIVKAREISDKLEKLGPEGIPDTKGELGNYEMWQRHSFNRGWFLLQDGNYKEGCQKLEAGRFLNVYGSPPLKTNAPIFNPEKDDIKGKSIIISLEGGYGDEIIHARFVQSFKKLGADKVYLAASPEVTSIFKRIEGCDGVILRNESHLVAHDYWVPGFSAGWVSGHTFQNLPNKKYLHALPEKIEEWKDIIKSDKLKVGIRWAGNPKFEHQQFRRFPPGFLTELGEYNEVQLYSLQRDQNIIDLPDNIIDLQHQLVSWEDTLAAIENLDIVITSCTSIAHAAGALGKKTWVLTPILPYHTWAFGSPHSTKSPYYDSVTLYRQKTVKTWNETFQKLYNDFEKEFKLKHVQHSTHDKKGKKLNMGCGYNPVKGFINVDCSEHVEADQIVDLQTVPWPWEDDEFQHILAKDILEHLGNEKHSFIDIIQEMYRVSENGAVWEVQFPHHRCDHAWDDPTHKRPLTPGTFRLFDQKTLIEGMELGRADSTFAIELGIDIGVCETQYSYIKAWADAVNKKEITQEQLIYALNTQSNVADSTLMLLQVHKPPRYTIQDLKDAIKIQKTKIKNPLIEKKAE
jgi:hypothetical protein